MKCRYCKRAIADNSIFCNWCGERQIKARRRPSEISVPEPRLLPSGRWNIELRKEGISVTRDTPDGCRRDALTARRLWLIDDASGLHEPQEPPLLLGDAIDAYLAARTNILSPSTIRSYKSYRGSRFQSCMSWDIRDDSNDWQMAINAELESVGPKTVFNAWHLITAVFGSERLPAPRVSLPRIPKAERPWLSYAQVGVFLDAMRDRPGELGALLALHSLRLSELLALKPENVSLKEEKLFIRGARVLNAAGELEFKSINKTDVSRRDIPIVIPRLKTLLKAAVADCAEYVCDDKPRRLYDRVNIVCARVGLPEVGVHGLRHSFASLAYHLGWKELSTMQVGGWKDSKIVRDIYTHNADLDADIQSMKKHYEDSCS